MFWSVGWQALHADLSWGLGNLVRVAEIRLFALFSFARHLSLSLPFFLLFPGFVSFASFRLIRLFLLLLPFASSFA